MFQIILTAAFMAFYSAVAVAASQDNEEIPQTLEEINNELNAKKAALEPFDQKDVKVDLESLGLDDLEPVNIKNNPETTDAKEIKKNQSEEKLPNQIIPKAGEVNKGAAIKEKTLEPLENKAKAADSIFVPAGSVNDENSQSKNNDNYVSKIQNFLNNKSNRPQKSASSNTNKTIDKHLDSTKKAVLKSHRQKKHEKEQQEKFKKLKELRQKYLIKINKSSSGKSDENFENIDDKIIPRRKEINPFISDEAPALPILNYYRSPDNLHIPAILTNTQKVTILFNAIDSGSVSFFNSAYKNVQDSNIKNQFGDTILTYSVLFQKHSIIASILAKGADPNMPNGLGYTPINIAIEMFDIKSLELLIENKADPGYIDGFGRTYLMQAARVGFLAAVELFTAAGVDINAMDNDGFTALSIAYRHKQELIVKYLLQNGAKTWIEKPYEPENQSLIRELENRWQ
jgi:ankyrin repeat protein